MAAVDNVGGDAVLRVGVLTVSDRCSTGEREDRSGPAVRRAAEELGFVVAIGECAPDDAARIAEILENWADDDMCDCILTVGGTGLSERDVTPEATVTVLDKQLPHLASQIALSGAKTVSTAVLSRAVAGTRGNVLIVNLPGSPAGASDGARIALAVAQHAVDVLRGNGDNGHK